MFSKILLAIDFSDTSLKTVSYAKKLKEAGTKEVILVSIIENVTFEEAMEICEYKDVEFEQCTDDIQEKLRKKCRDELESIGKTLGIDYKIEVRIGKPFVKILEIADEYDVSLIVMGSHGRGIVSELLLGSVSENVIRHSKIPVLIVR